MKKPFTPRVRRKFLGQYRPRSDGLEKASGRALYADDLTLRRRFPDLLYARVLRSPHPHARILSIDTAAAEALPGVRCVLTCFEPEVRALRPTNAGWTDGVDTVSYERMMWRRFRDRRVLGDTAHWVGDEVGAVVAAESEEVAEEALRRLKVRWQKLPFVLDPVAAMQPGAPAVHPDIAPTNVLPEDEVGGPDVFLNKGDVDAAFAAAEVVVEADSVHHNPTQGGLDPWCCLCHWTDEGLTVWSNSYEADQTRMHLAQMLDLPLHRVRSVHEFVGGQFGSRDTGDQPFFVFTALLSRRCGRPVKFRYTRRECFHDSRQPAIYHAKAGAKRDGTITALEFSSLGDAGAYADHTMFALKFAPLEVAETAFAHVPNVRCRSLAVYTHRLPGCMMRGVGNSQFNFSMGLLFDKLAERLGMDPLELVVKNFGHEHEPLPNRSLQAVLAAGAERIGWKEKRHPPGQGPLLGRERRRGVGFSFHPAWHAEWQELRRGEIQVGLTLNPDGTVLLEAPTVETGTGSNMCNILGCAEALSFLDIQLADIRFANRVDTAHSLKDCVQTDSAVAYLQSEALVEAARLLQGEILARAAKKLSADPARLDVRDGRIVFRDDSRPSVPLRQLLMQPDIVPISVRLSRPPLSQRTGVPYIATFAEVEVDCGTGKVEVQKLVVVNDCGTVMFASGAEAQQVGGQCIGLGEALTEEIVYDRASGQPLNFNWIDYAIPTMADMPDIEPVLLEVWRGGGAYGACGIGEGTVTCAPRAILNAIYNAIGSRVDELPVKPEKILRALGKA